MSVVIRRAEPADAEAIGAVTRAAFAQYRDADPPSAGADEGLDTVRADLAADPAWVALVDGRIAGALRSRVDPEAPDTVRWIRRVAVDPAMRRRQVAARLLQAVAAECTEHGFTAVRAEVRGGVPANDALYARLGWQLVAGDGTWVTYRLPLPRAVPDPAAMRTLGRALAAMLRPGDLVVADGPLGAGKTVLAQGIAAGLDVPDRITSPTFVLAREHTGGRFPFLHVDAYRLGSFAELDDLDLDTPLSGAVTVVEWGSGLAEQLADGHLQVAIARAEDPDEDTRTVTVRATGPTWAGRQRDLDRLPTSALGASA